MPEMLATTPQFDKQRPTNRVVSISRRDSLKLFGAIFAGAGYLALDASHPNTVEAAGPPPTPAPDKPTIIDDDYENQLEKYFQENPDVRAIINEVVPVGTQRFDVIPVNQKILDHAKQRQAQEEQECGHAAVNHNAERAAKSLKEFVGGEAEVLATGKRILGKLIQGEKEKLVIWLDGQTGEQMLQAIFHVIKLSTNEIVILVIGPNHGSEFLHPKPGKTPLYMPGGKEVIKVPKDSEEQKKLIEMSKDYLNRRSISQPCADSDPLKVPVVSEQPVPPADGATRVEFSAPELNPVGAGVALGAALTAAALAKSLETLVHFRNRGQRFANVQINIERDE